MPGLRVHAWIYFVGRKVVKELFTTKPTVKRFYSSCNATWCIHADVNAQLSDETNTKKVLNQMANERDKRQIYAQRRCVSSARQCGNLSPRKWSEVENSIFTLNQSQMSWKPKLNLGISLRGMKRKQDIKTDAVENVRTFLGAVYISVCYLE